MKGDEKERNGREDKWIEGKGSEGDSSEGVGGGKETIVKAMGVREMGGKHKLARRREGKVKC